MRSLIGGHIRRTDIHGGFIDDLCLHTANTRQQDRGLLDMWPCNEYRHGNLSHDAAGDHKPRCRIRSGVKGIVLVSQLCRTDFGQSRFLFPTVNF